jgi:hypothetical protein
MSDDIAHADRVAHLLDQIANAPQLPAKDLHRALRGTSWLADADDAQVEAFLAGLLAQPPANAPAAAQLLAVAFKQLVQRQRHRLTSAGSKSSLTPAPLIRSVYEALPEQDAPRSSLLAWLATAGTEASLQSLVDLLLADPPDDEHLVAEYFAPLFQAQASYDPAWLFPRLWPALQHPQLAAGVVDLANFLFRKRELPEHPAASRRSELTQLLGQTCQFLAKLEEGPEANQSPQEVTQMVARSVALAVALCDALALMQETPAIGKLHQALGLGHRRLKTEAAGALARLGDEQGRDELLALAAEPVARLRVLAYARELDLIDEVPDEFRTPVAEAEAELCVWLAEPTQFGLPPTRCELVDDREMYWPGFEEPVWCFLFRFTYSVLAQGRELVYSNVGIAGPVTHAFTADLGDLPPDDIYAAFAGWQAEHKEIQEFDVERLSQSERLEATRLERRLHDAGYSRIEPKLMGYFFGEKALVALAQREGVPGIAVVDFQDTYFYPTRDSRRSLGVREAYCIYKGRKLLRTFNP